MTPTPRKKPVTESIWLKVGVTVVSSACIGMFMFLWNLNAQLARQQAKDEAREEKVKTIDANVNTVLNDIKTIKDGDIQDIKTRLKTLEIKSDTP